MTQLSVVINTKNEEQNIANAINSVIGWCDEIIVMDMNSLDKTIDVARKLGAITYITDDVGYVEPARNKAINLANSEWVLILDADEEIKSELKQYVDSVIQTNSADFVRLARANVIFEGIPMHGNWWPDYNVRLFKKGSVIWKDEIHSQPQTQGVGIDAPADLNYAIYHHHYNTVSSFIQRLDRYTTIQARELSSHSIFNWSDLIIKPSNEFYRRYFEYQGWKDGTRGLALAVLQSFSEFVLYLKIWELNKFDNHNIQLSDFEEKIKVQSHNYHSWLATLYGKYHYMGKKIVHSIKKRL